jgi:hypothetical protein
VIPRLNEYEAKTEKITCEVDKLNNIVEMKNREIKEYQMKIEES